MEILLVILMIVAVVVITSVIGVNHYMAVQQMKLNQAEIDLLNTITEIQLLQMNKD